MLFPANNGQVTLISKRPPAVQNKKNLENPISVGVKPLL